MAEITSNIRNTDFSVYFFHILISAMSNFLVCKYLCSCWRLKELEEVWGIPIYICHKFVAGLKKKEKKIFAHVRYRHIVEAVEQEIRQQLFK